MPTDIYQQQRRVDAGSILAKSMGDREDVKMDIRVRHADKDTGLEAEVILYNLKRATWKGVKTGDPFRVTLGWKEDTMKTVFFGVVEQKFSRDDGADTEYILKGPDESKERLSFGYSHTWDSPTVAQVARDMAARAGLSIGRVDNGGSIEGRWPIMKDHPIEHWLKKLKRQALENTDEKFDVYAEAGKFYFVRKDQPIQTAIDLVARKSGGNAINVDEAEGKTEKSEGPPNLEFEAYLDPRLARKGLVNVSTAEYNGVYQVKDLNFESATESGEHKMSGTLAPTEARYRKVKSWSGATGEGANS